jgi:hypothetical protein
MILKKIYNIYLIALPIILIAESCEDIYHPVSIDSSAKIPVIKGKILENEAPSVTLSWATGYENDTLIYISGAQVYVDDNAGNSVQLYEMYAGYYSAYSNELTGVVGRSYTLRVVLPDGNEYTSIPVLMHVKPVIDSLYAHTGTREVYSFDATNDLMTETQKGLFIQSDLSQNSDSILYYRFNTIVLKEMVYIIGKDAPQSLTVYQWEISALDNDYSVDFSIAQNHRLALREHPVGFLRYYYDFGLETESTSAPSTVGWVLTFNVYSISVDVYNYYNSIANQLNSNDQLFAPYPTQILSNIRCVKDPSKKVLGVFEASSVTTIYKAFEWWSMDHCKSMDLASFPDIRYSGSEVSYPPNFWIHF